MWVIPIISSLMRRCWWQTELFGQVYSFSLLYGSFGPLQIHVFRVVHARYIVGKIAIVVRMISWILKIEAAELMAD